MKPKFLVAVPTEDGEIETHITTDPGTVDDIARGALTAGERIGLAEWLGKAHVGHHWHHGAVLVVRLQGNF